LGGSASVTPKRTAEEKYRKWFNVEGNGTLEGSEFTVGLVRGRTRGGDWGVSFVRKRFTDTSFVESDFQPEQCSGTPQFCSSFSSTYTDEFVGVYLDGVEFHSFIPFVTIKDRVQIGLNVGGGIAVPKGTVISRSSSTQTTTFNNQTMTFTDNSEFSQEAKEVLFPVVPLGKVEAAVAVILAPGLKVRVSGGLNVPGYSARIGLVYLFGGD
jgi:hypothetical protein